MSRRVRFRFEPSPPPGPPVIADAWYDASDPSPNATFVVAFDRAMEQDAGDVPVNWTFHGAFPVVFVGSSLSWDDAMHLRVHTSPGVPAPPRSGDYMQTGGDVRSAAGVPLASIVGFPVG